MELIYVGTEIECNVLRDAMNLVRGYPVPAPSLGLTEEETAATIAAWNSLTLEQRTDQAMYALMRGWTVQYSMLYREWTPGVRCACVVQSDAIDLIPAAQAAGRQIPLAYVQALQAAIAVATSNFPANWLTEPDPT